MSLQNVVFSVLFALPMCLSAKEFTLPVFTPSGSNAPVEVHGTLTGDVDSSSTHGFSCAAHLSLTNISTKPMLMMAIESRAAVKANGVVRVQLDQRDVYDYFFESDLLAPQQTIILETQLLSQRQPAETLTALKSGSAKVIADASVGFVQFADGSTWGDLIAGREFLQQREQAWKELRFLADLYHSNQQMKFEAALNEPAARVPYVGKLGLIYSQTKNIDAVVQEMAELLRWGNLHLRDAGEGVMNPAAARNSASSTRQ